MRAARARGIPALDGEVSQTAGIGEREGDLRASVGRARLARGDGQLPSPALTGDLADYALISSRLDDLANNLCFAHKARTFATEIAAAHPALLTVVPLRIDGDRIAILVDEL